MKHFKLGQLVSAIVDGVFPFGVFVKLDGDVKAYIRRRELSLDGNQNPIEFTHIGDTIEAIIIKVAEDERMMELSLRQTLPDPWEQFILHFSKGDVVRAVVQSILPDRIYADIIPGVTGIIKAKELATWEMGQPGDVFWPSDQIEAVVIQINPKNRRVYLSIKQRLIQLEAAQDIFKAFQLRQQPPLNSSSIAMQTSRNKEHAVANKLISNLHILLVEDDDNLRKAMSTWFTNQGAQVTDVSNVKQALVAYPRMQIDLIIADIDMPGSSGITLIEHIRQKDEPITIAVMSDPNIIASKLMQLRELRVAAAFPKPIEINEMLNFIERVAKGEQVNDLVVMDNTEDFSQNALYYQLTYNSASHSSLKERLETYLARVSDDTRAEQAIIFFLDRVSERISILATYGELPLQMDLIYKLIDSPVNDVISRKETILENQVTEKYNRRFEKLLSFIQFESCVAVPVQTEMQTDHALFLFHRSSDAFSRFRLRDAMGMSTFIAGILSEDFLRQQVMSLSSIFLSGQLAAGFGHEIFNLISGIDLQFRNLQNDIHRLAAGQLISMDGLISSVDGAVNSAKNLRQTVEYFRDLMEPQIEDKVQVNQVLRQATEQVSPYARRAKVNITLKLDEKIGYIHGSYIGLLQVCLNLMLNAVQQMEQQPNLNRELIVSSRTQPVQKVIAIDISDNGPGIHYQLWERIFNLGFTTRPNGSGIGLFIAMNLVTAMNGRVFVADSLITLGSTFRIELPDFDEYRQDGCDYDG